MKYATPTTLTGKHYVRMDGEAKKRVDAWLYEHKLLERYMDINSIEILGPRTFRIMRLGDNQPVRLTMDSPLSLTEWIAAIDQAAT